MARTHAEAAERRTRFLLEATNALGESLDAGLTLARLSEVCVRHMGDWCVIDLVETNRSLSRVAVEQLDEADAQLALGRENGLDALCADLVERSVASPA